MDSGKQQTRKKRRNPPNRSPEKREQRKEAREQHEAHNEQLECRIPGCPKLRFKISGLCYPHNFLKQLRGSPVASNWAHLKRPWAGEYIPRVRQLIESNPGHPGITQALGIIREWRSSALRDERGALEHGLALRMGDVDLLDMDVLVATVALYVVLWHRGDIVERYCGKLGDPATPKELEDCRVSNLGHQVFHLPDSWLIWTRPVKERKEWRWSTTYLRARGLQKRQLGKAWLEAHGSLFRNIAQTITREDAKQEAARRKAEREREQAQQAEQQQRHQPNPIEQEHHNE